MIKDFEGGKRTPTQSNVLALERVFVERGVGFGDSDGREIVEWLNTRDVNGKARRS